MTRPALAALASRRVLVAEDGCMVADGIATVLGDVGAETLGPVPGVAGTLRLLWPEAGSTARCWTCIWDRGEHRRFRARRIASPP